MSEDYLSADDVRRELEALGFTRSIDRAELMKTARDAYSEVWEPSRHLQMDHERALGHTIAAVAEMIQEFAG